MSAVREPVVDAVAYANADALLRLLGGRAFGVQQTTSGKYAGKYPGERHMLTRGEIVRHFGDLETVAIVTKGTSHFLGLDIDEKWDARCKLLKAALELRGWGAATICSGGSSSERGKVLVWFSQALDVRVLRREALAIVDGARKDASWGIDTKRVDVRPTEIKDSGESGLLRIGGRNRDPERNATAIDRFEALDGSPKTLAEVRPTSWTTAIPALPNPLAGRSLPARVAALVYGETIAKWGGLANHKLVARAQKRLAHECLRAYGPGVIGRTAFVKLWETWRLNSPALSAPTTTTDDTRDIFRDEQRDRTWSKTADTHRTFVVVDHPNGKTVLGVRHAAEAAKGTTIIPPATSASSPSQGSMYSCAFRLRGVRPRKVLEAHVRLVNERGLNPACYGLSLDELARTAGLFVADGKTGKMIPDKPATLRASEVLVRRGFLVRHDRGLQGTAGRGRVALYGLNLQGDPALVAASGDAHFRVQKRRDEVGKRRCVRAERPPSPKRVEIASSPVTDSPTVKPGSNISQSQASNPSDASSMLKRVDKSLSVRRELRARSEPETIADDEDAIAFDVEIDALFAALTGRSI